MPGPTGCTLLTHVYFRYREFPTSELLVKRVKADVDADDVVDDVIDDTVQVVARDDESGDEVSTLVEVEVLPRGRAGKQLWQLTPVVRSLTSTLWPFQCPMVPSGNGSCLETWAADWPQESQLCCCCFFLQWCFCCCEASGGNAAMKSRLSHWATIPTWYLHHTAVVLHKYVSDAGFLPSSHFCDRISKVQLCNIWLDS